MAQQGKAEQATGKNLRVYFGPFPYELNWRVGKWIGMQFVRGGVKQSPKFSIVNSNDRVFGCIYCTSSEVDDICMKLNGKITVDGDPPFPLLVFGWSTGKQEYDSLKKGVDPMSTFWRGYDESADLGETVKLPGDGVDNMSSYLAGVVYRARMDKVKVNRIQFDGIYISLFVNIKMLLSDVSELLVSRLKMNVVIDGVDIVSAEMGETTGRLMLSMGPEEVDAARAELARIQEYKKEALDITDEEERERCMHILNGEEESYEGRLIDIETRHIQEIEMELVKIQGDKRQAIEIADSGRMGMWMSRLNIMEKEWQIRLMELRMAQRDRVKK